MSPSATEILSELQSLGRESYKRVMLNHGAAEPCYGVKIEDLKKILKRVKPNHPLALELYDSGMYDAMYLAGLLVDDRQMTKEDLRHWLELACQPLTGCTVPWVAAGSLHGWEMALEWIDSPHELFASAGWATLSSLVSILADSALDLVALRGLLNRVQREIRTAPNRVTYQMNGFIICLGCYVQDLTTAAIEVGEFLGPLRVDMGKTDCDVPYAPDYIRKVQARGTIGKKRRTAKC
jgi:hypothetical protein